MTGNLPNENAPALGFNQYSWSPTEANFFRLGYRTSDLQPRTGETYRYHPLLVQAYNAIAEQNEQRGFIDSIAIRGGVPNWEQSFVYFDSQDTANLVALPLYFEADRRITSVISVVKDNNKSVIDIITRDEATTLVEGEGGKDFAEASIFAFFDKRLFSSVDPKLVDARCESKKNKEELLLINSPTSPNSPPCEWRLLELCSDDESQTSWIGGMQNIPIHLDHDQDGFVNDQDQDWHEFQETHGNITQEQFQIEIENWWNLNMEPTYGEYEDIEMNGFSYNGVPLGDLEPIDWADVWDDIQDALQDFYDSLEDAGNNVLDGFDDFGDWIHELFDPGEGCFDNPIVQGETPLEERSEIICEWYFVLDCPEDPTGGSGWWSEFNDLEPCPGCLSGSLDEQDYELRVQNFIENNMLSGIPGLWQELVQSNGPLLCPVYVTDNFLADQTINFLLAQSPGVTLTPEARAWIVAHKINLGLWYEILTSGDYPSIDLNYALNILQFGGDDFSLQDFIDRYAMLEYMDAYANGTWDPVEPQPYVEDNPNVTINWTTANVSALLIENPNPQHLAGIPYRHPDNSDLQHSLNGDLTGVNNVFVPIAGTINNSETYCEIVMQTLLHNLSNGSIEDAADDFLYHFLNGAGQNHSSQLLNNGVNEHIVYRRLIYPFAKLLNEKLSLLSEDIYDIPASNFGAGALYAMHPKFNEDEDFAIGYKVLINDTEKYDISTLSYEYNPTTQQWTGLFKVVVLDNFGLDKNDVLTYQNKPWAGNGFAAWYRLQHQHNNIPFRNVMTFVFSASGTLVP